MCANPSLIAPKNTALITTSSPNRSHGTSGNAGWIENRRCIGATGKNPHDIAGYDLYKTGPMNFQHAVGFLDTHLDTDDTKQQPFFLYYAANANHTPHTPCDALNGVPITGQAHFKNGKRELSRPHATTNDPNGWESTEWGKQRDQVGGCEHNTPRTPRLYIRKRCRSRPIAQLSRNPRRLAQPRPQTHRQHPLHLFQR